jgi:hypothetical protein
MPSLGAFQVGRTAHVSLPSYRSPTQRYNLPSTRTFVIFLTRPGSAHLPTMKVYPISNPRYGVTTELPAKNSENEQGDT